MPSPPVLHESPERAGMPRRWPPRGNPPKTSSANWRPTASENEAYSIALYEPSTLTLCSSIAVYEPSTLKSRSSIEVNEPSTLIVRSSIALYEPSILTVRSSIAL
jgi:hypothetical protein